MTGDYDSVIGMEKEEPVRRFITKVPGNRLEPAAGAATLCGLAVETNTYGHAIKVAPVRVGWPVVAGTSGFLGDEMRRQFLAAIFVCAMFGGGGECRTGGHRAIRA